MPCNPRSSRERMSGPSKASEVKFICLKNRSNWKLKTRRRHLLTTYLPEDTCLGLQTLNETLVSLL